MKFSHLQLYVTSALPPHPTPGACWLRPPPAPSPPPGCQLRICFHESFYHLAVGAVQLYQELRLDPSARLMIRVRPEAKIEQHIKGHQQQSHLAVSRESISSMKITLGSWTLATANNALTIFSPSPTHFEVNEEADIEKNVDPD